MKYKPDGFILAIAAVVAIAYWFPQWGEPNSGVPLGTISDIGVSLIFFFYGLKLSPDKLRNGLRNLRLHLLVHFSSFVLFPLIVLGFYPFVQSEDTRLLWLSFLFLAALPSTVSSSVVMVSIASGNIPAAIFNASLSGLIGIVITPMWMGAFLPQTADSIPLTGIYLQLVVGILLPVLAGILMQRYWGGFAQRYGRQLSLFDKSVILLIIYRSFADSFAAHLFSAVSWPMLAAIAAGVVGLFFTAYYITGYAARKLRLNREDTITARFCGTKKSLVHGTVFSGILFPASVPTGIILLPLMLFHAFQLFVISVIASGMAKEPDNYSSTTSTGR